jgi:hypothetical protein
MIQTGAFECLPPIPVVFICVNMPSKIMIDEKPAFIARKEFDYQLSTNSTTNEKQLTFDVSNTQITVSPEKQLISIIIPLK